MSVDRGSPPAAIAGVFAALALGAIGAFASPSPFCVASCGACLAFLLLLLWRRRDPPVLLLPAVFQWSEVSIVPISTIWRQLPLNQLSPLHADLEASTLYGLAGVTALGIGLRLGAGSPRGPGLASRLSADAAKWRFREVAGFAFPTMLGGSMLAFLSRFAGPARELFLEVGNVHYVGLFVLAYWCLFRKSHYPVLAAVVAFEIVSGTTGFFADFKNSLLTLLVAALAARPRIRGGDLLVVTAAAGLIFMVAIFWSAVKEDYRKFVNEGTGAQVVNRPFGERVGYMRDALWSMTGERFAIGFDRLVARHGYTEFLGLTMAYVPEFRPHENGQLSLAVLEHITMPRFLFPDKAALPSDTAVMAKYTGQRVSRDPNTSISIGYLGELYVDFGYYGALVATAFVGFLVGWVNRLLQRDSDCPALVTGGLCLISALPIAYFGLAYIKVIGSFVFASAVALAVQRYGLPKILPKLMPSSRLQVARRADCPLVDARSVHVVGGLAREDGGPAYSVPALVRALRRRQGNALLRTVSGGEPGGDVDVARHRSSRGPLGAFLRASPDLRRALQSDGASGSILHAHGIWLMPNVYPSWVKKGSQGAVKLVHSPRGMLAREALAISAWKKAPFWALLQRRALESADCLHATAASERQEIRAAGLRNPVAVIPNGIDLPDLGTSARARGAERIVLSLGRIHPKKGLDRLVRAWATIEGDFPEARLRIVGPAEAGHDDELRRIAASYGARHIAIEAPIYGAGEKLAAYRGADVFVLSTLNENFGMTVAEALAAELPVISTKGAPWAGLEIHRCGWWIDHGIDPLAAALRHALTTPREELDRMGQRGRTWMAREFGWDRIARDMSEVYRWLKAGGEPPPTVSRE